jgi:preprotein translocase subunit SecD
MKKAWIVILILFCIGCAKGPEPLTIEFRLAQLEPEDGLTEMTFAATGETYYLHDEVLLDDSDLSAAKAIDWQGETVVDLTFNEAGKQKLERVTGEHVTKRLGMVVGGKLLSAPVINAPITQGRAVIAGRLTPEEAQRIASGIAAGLKTK